MKRISWLLCLTLLAVAAPVSAAVFERDLVLGSGDGLLTFDDVNQREWLDVPETLLLNFGSFENVVAQTGPGGMFEGFSAAKSIDVFALAESAGIDINSSSLIDNEVPARHLIGLLGETVQLSGGRVSTTGMLDEFSVAIPASRLVANNRVTPQIDTASFEVVPFSAITLDRPFRVTGVMLFRPVPEPSTYLIALFGATMLMFSASRSQAYMKTF